MSSRPLFLFLIWLHRYLTLQVAHLHKETRPWPRVLTARMPARSYRIHFWPSSSGGGYCAIQLNYPGRLPDITHRLQRSLYTHPGTHCDKQGPVPDYWLTVMKHAVLHSFIKEKRIIHKSNILCVLDRRTKTKKYFAINQVIKVNTTAAQIQHNTNTNVKGFQTKVHLVCLDKSKWCDYLPPR